MSHVNLQSKFCSDSIKFLTPPLLLINIITRQHRLCLNNVVTSILFFNRTLAAYQVFIYNEIH